MTNLPVIQNTRARICGTALQSGWIAGMCDPNWISAANTHQVSSILSKSRANFGMEVSSQSTHFSRAKNARVNRLHNATANETWPEAELQRGWRDAGPHLHCCASLTITS
jgi:hypothetical protein